ncbi:MAG TPA: ATP-binding protein, partial [Chitinophagaceae bacterium]|nr:ATP-binding protein [Chitinophagaceae bacterium]
MNNLWITSADKGISKYNPDSKNGPFTLFPELENIGITTVNSVLEDQKGNIWFGTGGGGVISYRPVGSLDTSFDPNSTNVKFTHYTKNEGLISNNIVDILEDNDNDLWFSSSDGISKLNKNYSQEWTNQNKYQDKLPSNFKSPTLFKNYTYSDGYPGSGRTNTIDKNGTIWIGSNSRLTAFHPGLEIPDTIPPNIQLANLALFNENIYWPLLQSKIDTSFVLGNGERIHDLQFEEVNKWYGIPQGLSLAYDNNHLNFRYVGITTHSPKKVSYQYKLEGLDHNWSALTDRTEISYNNLSHGAYNFKLKAMNSEGYWSRELNYTFRIRPPWWLSTEAYIFYGLSLITGLFFTDRIQRKRVLEKERAKTREREYEQAKEIEKAYIILKDTQAQLIQSEKMASLGELTAGIAHEIQNPLNFVNNFSEVNSELIDELQSELKQGNTNEALCLSNGIKENESKINLHGKRAESIVKSMLQHSQKSSGVKEPTDINVLAEEYMRLSYHGLRAKDKSFQAELKMNLDPTLPLVNIIPQDIGRVLLNLFNNAFWACAERSLSAEMEEGNKKSEQDLEGLDTGKHVRNLPGLVPTYTPIVTLTTHNLNDKIEIRIRDNGPGIPPHVIEKIFQPFFTTKPTGQGTGLGLSLAYDIVKAHTGSISVKSEEGEGTEFDIILPVG